jgi:peptidoglycan glycosyltransferase
LKKDEKNEMPKKSVRKINIDEIPEDSFEEGKGDTKIFTDLPLNDGEDFEFHPDFDDMDFWEDTRIEEPKVRSGRRRGSADSAPKKTYDSEEPSGKKREINKIKLSPEEIQERKAVRKKRRSQNPEILAVTYVFAFLFVLMIGYFVYFNAFVSKDVINSAYNVRINSFADTIIRGSILSSDGTVLAETLVDEDGNETRYYPMGRIFSHVVGTSEINQSGIELSQNFYMLQSNANPIWNALQDIRGEKNQGDQIVTTLNSTLQEVAYNALGNNDGAVIAIEPATGKILAMVSKPDYDPNTLVNDYESIISDDTNESLLNKTTFGLFVPGSIFKTLTALAYIRSGADYNSYSYYCEGQINLGGDEYITCFDQTSHGQESFMDSFAYSCNSSFGNIGLGLSDNLLKETCESLFFNKSLPTDIPHTKSIFSLASDDTDWQTAATAIGQGHTQVTPLQMAMIAATIANGGNMMEPYLVDSVETAGGGRRVKKYLPESYGQVLSTQEADLLGSLMEAVTDYGTATALSGYGYSVAGKTGTAEVAGKGDNSWFIGYAPADQPQIAICVLVENDEGYYESALPVANAVFQAYLGQ